MISALNRRKDNLLIIKDRFSVSWRKYGFGHIMKIFLLGAIKPLVQFQNFKIFVKDIEKNSADNLSANGVRLRVFTDILELNRNLKGELLKMNPHKLSQSRFMNGEFCAIAEDKQGSQVFSLWFTAGRQDIDYDFAINDDEAYFYNAYTLSYKRGRNIYPHTLNLLSAYLSKKGIKKLYCIILPGWVASIKGVRKAGFREIGKLRYIKFFMIDRLTRILH